MVDFTNNSYNFSSDPVISSDPGANDQVSSDVSQASPVESVLPEQPTQADPVQPQTVIPAPNPEPAPQQTIQHNQNLGSNSVSQQVVPDQAPQVQSFNFAADGEEMEKEAVEKNKNNSFSGFVKLFLLLFIPIVLVASVGLYIMNSSKEANYRKEKDVLLVFPMTSVNWQDIGTVFEPIIKLPVKTKSGYEKWEFLIDSGAVISSLPRDWADKMGKDLAFMQRSTFRGFGGKTSFAYQGDMTVMLGEEEYSMPVVFTEASGTKSLLGRKGFFEDHSLYFNHKEKRIEIRK